MEEIKLYQKPNMPDTSYLAYFTISMYCINNYLETLKSTNHKFFQKYEKLYKMTYNINSDGMSKKDSAAFEGMLDIMSDYLEDNVSGGWEFKFRVLLSASLLFFKECKSDLIASRAYEIQSLYNKDGGYSNLRLLDNIVDNALADRNETLNIKPNKSALKKVKVLYKRHIGSKAALPYNNMMKAMKFYANDPDGELGRSFFNHCKVNLFVTCKP